MSDFKKTRKKAVKELELITAKVKALDKAINSVNESAKTLGLSKDEKDSIKISVLDMINKEKTKSKEKDAFIDELVKRYINKEIDINDDLLDLIKNFWGEDFVMMIKKARLSSKK